MTLDVMVDIETLGSQSYSTILSIGAVRFNINTGDIYDPFYKKITLQSNLDLGFKITPSTLKWWLQQNHQTLDDLLDSTEDIRSVLISFQHYLLAIDVRAIWGNSARFDLGLLQNAYDKLGIQIPWDFRKERCYRTIVQETGGVDKTKYVGVQHNALDDCMNQVAILIDRYKYFTNPEKF